MRHKIFQIKLLFLWKAKGMKRYPDYSKKVDVEILIWLQNIDIRLYKMLPNLIRECKFFRSDST